MIFLGFIVHLKVYRNSISDSLDESLASIHFYLSWLFDFYYCKNPNKYIYRGAKQ